MEIKKLAVYGGSFDPIHMGHLMIAEQARAEYGIDKVLFMPALLSPFKEKQTTTDASERVELVRAATEENEFFEVSDLELQRKPPSYTIDTILLLKEKYPDTEIYFLIGADSLFFLEKWMTFEKLFQEVIFLVAPRPGSDLESVEAEMKRLMETYPSDFRLVHSASCDISSTLIRKRLQEGQSVRYLLHDRVLAIIQEKGLYEKERRLQHR
ncbi:nicotinate-nucleotide adenylyltransferase [Guggenheimella bovis]